MPVEFENLWKTVAAVGKVEGFDLTPFDNICQKARCATDPIVEPQPLWEYPSVCTGDAVSIAKFDITSPVPLNDVTYSALLRLSRYFLSTSRIFSLFFNDYYSKGKW